MKKNIIVLLALAISLGAMAEGNLPTVKTNNAWPTVNADPFTCEAPSTYTIKSSAQGSYAYKFYYSANDGDLSGTRSTLPSLSVRPTQGLNTYYVFVGHAGNPRDIYPWNHEYWTLADGYMPEDFVVDYIDVFTINVEHPVVEHYDTIYVDVASKTAEFELYSTVGKKSKDGKEYCLSAMFNGKVYNIIRAVAGGTTPIEKAVQDKDMPYSLTLTEGTYAYYVTTGYTQINAPARENSYIQDPPLYGLNNIEWSDLFHIKVVNECRNDLLYRKWNDVMFVNNGSINNGGDSTFVAYQWYKDGKLIEGATNQWYQEENPNENTRTEYYCKITDKNGKVIYTCGTYFSDMKPSLNYNKHKPEEKVAARKIMRDGQFLVERDGQLYTITGERVE